jgi:hypothetical protein
MADQRSLEVLVQLNQDDVYRGNVDVSLARLTPYRWLTFGASSTILGAVFSFLIFSHANDFAAPSSAVLFGGLFGLVIGPAVLIGVIHVNSRKAAKSLFLNAQDSKGQPDGFSQRMKSRQTVRLRTLRFGETRSPACERLGYNFCCFRKITSPISFRNAVSKPKRKLAGCEKSFAAACQQQHCNPVDVS